MDKNLELYVTTPEINVVEAMQKIDKGAKGIVFVVDEQRRLIGCVTDGDIRRWLIKSADLKVPISKLMFPTPKYVFSSDDIDAESYMKKYLITALPVLNVQREIVDILFLNSKHMQIKKKEKFLMENVPVIIMAGGKGTRLYPYTRILPKPLIPIDGIPIIERIMNQYTEYGVRDFYLTVNYKKGMIRSYFDELNPDYHISYVEEDKPLGTGGSLRLIKDNFERPIFVTNCDTLIEADYTDIYNRHLESGNAITIVSALKNQIIPYGVLQVGEQGIVNGIEEKPNIPYFINTGMYIIKPELIDLIPLNTFYHMTNLTEDAIKRGMKVGMYPISEEAFLDMGELEEMQKMEEKLRV